MSRLILISMVAAAVLNGCGRFDSGIPYAELPDDAVMASVDGVKYLKADLERDSLIMSDLAKLARTDEAEIVSATDPEAFRRSTVARFIERELLVKEAERRRLSLTPEEFDDFQERFATDFAEKMPIGFKAIVEALGPRSAAFRANLRRDALAEKIHGHIRDGIAAQTQVTPSEAMGEQRGFRELNDEIAATNEATRAAARRAWRSICKGNDFDMVGRKLPELRADVSYEADCIETNAAFAKLKVGEISSPTDVAGGLVIVKALGPDLKGRLHFGKIAYSLDEQFAVPTVDDAQKGLFEARVDAGYAAWLDGLRRNARVYNRFGE